MPDEITRFGRPPDRHLPSIPDTPLPLPCKPFRLPAHGLPFAFPALITTSLPMIHTDHTSGISDVRTQMR